MNNNISAFIVAGGKGSRLGTLGEQTQKCMLELWGKPMLYYPIVLLRNAGCKKIVIAVNHLSEQIKNYFKDGKEFGVEITYIEDDFISTYDAMYKSLSLLSSRILYIHANILFQDTLLKNIISIGNQQNKNIIAVIPNNALNLKHAQVSIDSNGDISAIDLKECNNKYPYTFLGVAYYKKQDFITQFNGNSSGMVEKVIQQLLDANEKTLTYHYQGDWRHIETEQDYLTIKQEGKWGTSKVIPSLVLNVTDKCNMQCKYCPPCGENLCKGKEKIDISVAKILIKYARQNQFKTVRLTGGEPLLFPSQLQILLEECGNSFERLVLNTNGVLLDKNFEWLEKHKNNLVLKISFDSLNRTEFNYQSQSAEFDKVFDNINTAISLGFQVEINTVLVNQSFDSIKQLIAHFTEKKIPIKLLTLSNYFGNVKTESNFDLDELINYLEIISENKINEQLNGNRGVDMRKYTINNTTVFFIDHSCKSSKTPVKCYFNNCAEICNLFPCNCGALSLSLSTDGILSSCKGRKDLGINIFNKSETEIAENFDLLLKQFDNCIKIDVNKQQNHILVAIEGIDGVGKTTIAKALVEKLKFDFSEKELQNIWDISPENYVLLRDKLKESNNKDVMALFFCLNNLLCGIKSTNNNVIADRYIATNYFWWETEQNECIYDAILSISKKPILTVILTAKTETLQQRIMEKEKENLKKREIELEKTQYNAEFVPKIRMFLERKGLDFIIVDNDSAKVEDVVNAIINKLNSINVRS